MPCRVLYDRVTTEFPAYLGDAAEFREKMMGSPQVILKRNEQAV
jgi:hypothetical protein